MYVHSHQLRVKFVGYVGLEVRFGPSKSVQHRRLSPNIFLSTLRFFFTMTFLQVCVI